MLPRQTPADGGQSPARFVEGSRPGLQDALRQPFSGSALPGMPIPLDMRKNADGRSEAAYSGMAPTWAQLLLCRRLVRHQELQGQVGLHKAPLDRQVCLQQPPVALCNILPGKVAGLLDGLS